MRKCKVETHYGGYKVVVWRSPQHYLAASVCINGGTCIELVRSGQCYLRTYEATKYAPDTIIDLMRRHFYP